MIDVNNLSRTFRTPKGPVHALKNVSLQVPPGAVLGLVGPNGAGKTTFLRTVATVLKTVSGSVQVNGFDSRRDPGGIRRSIGFLTGDMKMAGSLSPLELLTIFGKLNKMSGPEIDQRIETISSYLGITDYLRRSINSLSTGMKQKALIAVTILHDPQVLLLDEVMNGLDLFAVREIKEFIVSERLRQKTIVFSSHIFADLEEVCDHVAIMSKGEIIAMGKTEVLLAEHSCDSVEDLFFQLVRKG